MLSCARRPLACHHTRRPHSVSPSIINPKEKKGGRYRRGDLLAAKLMPMQRASAGGPGPVLRPAATKQAVLVRADRAGGDLRACSAVRA